MIDPITAALGAWSSELNGCSVLLRILLTFVLSAIIGCERSSKRHSAGLRTFIVVSLSATVAMLLDSYLMQYHGIGFFAISAATVLSISVLSVHSLMISSRSQIKGLTTAGGLWACGMIGLASGAGLYTVTLIAFLALLCCLSWFPAVERYLKNRSNHFEIHLELRDSHCLGNFVTTIRRLGLTIDEIEKNPAYADSGLSVYSVAISISSPELKKFKTHKEIIEALSTLNYISHIEEMIS